MSWSVLMVLICVNSATNVWNLSLHWYAMHIIEAVWIMKLHSIVVSCVVLIIKMVLVCLLHYRVGSCLLAGHALWILILAVWIDKLWVIIMIVVMLLLYPIPALLTYEWVAILLILVRIVFEKSGWCWRLGLIVVVCLSTNIFTLVEFIIGMKISFNWFTNLLIIIHNISVANILGVDASTTSNHRESLSMKILIRVRCKTTTNVLLVMLLVVVTTRG